ncbi:hypothetical protein CLOM621_05221 [Clostridium sp. M62/1]|nr:hypothetical protein CLOM621_05221 [Clostridium sp. M62/1]
MFFRLQNPGSGCLRILVWLEISVSGSFLHYFFLFFSILIVLYGDFHCFSFSILLFKTFCFKILNLNVLSDTICCISLNRTLY